MYPPLSYMMCSKLNVNMGNGEEHNLYISYYATQLKITQHIIWSYVTHNRGHVDIYQVLNQYVAHFSLI